MDPRIRGFSSNSRNGVQLGSQYLSNQNLVVSNHAVDTTAYNNFKEFHCLPPNPTSINGTVYPTNLTHQDEPREDCEFSDTVLRYISQILMEEDMEDKTCMLQDSLDLQAVERPFYEALGEKYPPSPNPYSGFTSSSSNGNGRIRNSSDCGSFPSQALSVSTVSRSSYSSSNSIATSFDGVGDSPSSCAFRVPDWSGESQSILQFQKGVEEASKFLPSGDMLLLNTKPRPKTKSNDVEVKVEKKNELSEVSVCWSKGRKNPLKDDGVIEEERSSKQQAVFDDPILRSDVFDRVLLTSTGEGKADLTALQEKLKNASIKNDQNGAVKGPNVGKGRTKKNSRKKELVDLTTLLMNCAQAVAADDCRTANELLKQIRNHSSPFGEGNQRLAHCFADGLEARLAGTGSQIYKGLVSKRTPAANILKAYQLYLAACPFRKLSNLVSIKTIRNIAGNSKSVHVIDFGILYGFQWPTLIQRLSWREGGPPRLRITGIDFPQPGFRPAERVEETGRRLAAYAKKFGVPFEYNAIAKKWETVQLEELKIDRNDFVVVNCLYRAKNLLDETVAADSPRNIFLNLIKKINPDIFIHGVVNGSYNAPFFVTRFREALFHFSAMFDMLETIVPRIYRDRMVIEKEIFCREALNVVACEGWERVERPETYKQWQVRTIRAGFAQLPLDREVVNRATDKVRTLYHKNFQIDEDGHWLLQGWKGRTIYSISVWKPVQEVFEPF